MKTRTVDNGQDIIDSRDVIARIDELRGELEGAHEQACTDEGESKVTTSFEDWLKEQAEDNEDAQELLALEALQDEADGYSSDWRHGATLIRDSYFKIYAQQLADDIGAIDLDAKWPCTCIDWEQAADELKADYTQVDFDGVEYWVQ